MVESDPRSLDWMDHLRTVFDEDLRGVVAAQQHYGNSWKRRGGVGAVMMMLRKVDRIEKQLSECDRPWDVFHALATDGRSEGIIDDLRDLRRYLGMIEAEARAMGIGSSLTTHRDNELDARPRTCRVCRRYVSEGEGSCPTDGRCAGP